MLALRFCHGTCRKAIGRSEKRGRCRKSRSARSSREYRFRGCRFAQKGLQPRRARGSHGDISTVRACRTSWLLHSISVIRSVCVLRRAFSSYNFRWNSIHARTNPNRICRLAVYTIVRVRGDIGVLPSRARQSFRQRLIQHPLLSCIEGEVRLPTTAATSYWLLATSSDR
jgi:hypothetical protein